MSIRIAHLTTSAHPPPHTQTLHHDRLLVTVAFNSFPDYHEVDSWEGSLKKLTRCMCCGSMLEEVALDTSESASREIAKNLSILFGGIDLDPTDRLFAMLLLGEHQGELRQRQVRAALAQAGYVTAEPQHGAFFWGSEWRDRGTLRSRPTSFHEALRRVGLLDPATAEQRPVYRRTYLYSDGANKPLASESSGDEQQASHLLTASMNPYVCQHEFTLRVRAVYKPLLTPVHLPIAYCGDLTAQEAATIYSGRAGRLRAWCGCL